MKTFVDNVCRQVVERHVLDGLMRAFDPISISKLSDDELLRIGSESSQTRIRRTELSALREALEKSLLQLSGQAL